MGKAGVFSWGRKASQPETTVGVAWSVDGFALASVVHGSDGPRLEVCDERASGGDGRRALQTAVREHGLVGSRCVWILPEGAYSLRLIDAPEVPSDELREAARWIVKDLIDFEADSAAMDVLEMPQTPSPARPRKVYVAAARPDAVRRAVDWAREAGLEPAAVSVPESVLLNLEPSSETPRSVALLQLRAKDGLLVMGEGGCLYAARHLSVSLDELAAQAGGDLEGAAAGEAPALENLLLEIQRSLDYYESAFGRSSASRLLLAPSDVEVPALLPYLSQNLSVSVHGLEVAQRLSVQGTLPYALQARALTAVAAALESSGSPSIDLGRGALHPVEAPLSARRLAQAAGLATLLLGAAGAWAAWQNAQASRDLAALEARRDALEARVSELASQHAARPVDAALQERVRSLSQERDAKVRLLENLSHHARADARRFPDVLEGLARRPVSGLWLREVHVTEAGASVALVGSSLHADLVPRFLQELEGEWAFEGTGFQKLELSRQAEDATRLDFTLSTRAEETAP